MISEIKRAKFMQYFEVTDTNGDGKITKQDYLLTADKTIAVLKLDPASPLAQILKANYAQGWDALAVRDLDHDDAVTVDEWIEHYYLLSLDEKLLDPFVNGRAEAIFRLFDADQDQRITKEEWTVFFSAIGHPEKNYEMGFQKLDRNQNDHLTLDEVKKASHEFFGSDDPDAIGNWLFGDYTRHLRT
mgnify:CR=1 FL=1